MGFHVFINIISKNQQIWTNTLEHKNLFANHISTIRPFNKLLTMKTTTETGKNQKFSRKVPEENVEAIQHLSSTLKTLFLIRWTSSLNQWELSAVGWCDKVSKRSKIKIKVRENLKKIKVNLVALNF